MMNTSNPADLGFAFDLPSNVTLTLNSTVGFCEEWEAAQHKLFQAANFFFAAAFLVPRTFKASVLALRGFLTVGFMLVALWAGITICALDAMLWALALGLLNGIHSLILACRLLPPALSPDLAELYLRLFKPYRVSKKHFQELSKAARVLKLDRGQVYAVEGVSPADQRLSVLLRGRLTVSCNGTDLHQIRQFQFIDSPEWESVQEDLDSLFQVTVRADQPSTYICWTRIKLIGVLRHRPALRTVVNALIGKDITLKLYSLNEELQPRSQNEGSSSRSKFRMPRSLSLDEVHTEVRGRVRSTNWRVSTADGESSKANGSVVARHFLSSFPFTVLDQPVPRDFKSQPSVSRQTQRRKSFSILPRRDRKSRKSREVRSLVTFETPISRSMDPGSIVPLLSKNDESSLHNK